jgi:arylamine N-acetyltransferase
MANTLDLAAYLDRVNWHGPTERTYATLSGLLEAHIAHIPFENFDVLLGRPVRLYVEGSSLNWSCPAAAAIASSMQPCSPQCWNS